MEEGRIKHCSKHDKILLVGEGDFSFAASLATAFGSAANIVATSLDSREELVLKYPSVFNNLRKLEERGCTILHGVDCRTMSSHPQLHCRFFDRIIFNFPHAGFLHGREHNAFQIQEHQKLVQGFFHSAVMMVFHIGEVHVTHKAAYPFTMWEIETLAAYSGFSLLEKAGFLKWEYPGYENKRGSSNGRYSANESFPVGVAHTYKFKKL